MATDSLHRFIFRPAGLGLALGAIGLTACGNRLDTGNVEATIKADIERQGRRLSLQAVRCPSDVTRQAGAYFRCVGELSPEGTFTINVTQTDSQGNITWDVPNSKALLNLPRVEETIQDGLGEAFGKRALVDCGTAIYRVNQPGDRFQCQVVGGLETGTSRIDTVLVRVDSDGNLSWQEMPAIATLAAATTAAPGPAPAAAPAGATPAAATAAPKPAVQLDPAATTTTTTGPTGRVINRPYIPGDSD